MYQSALRRSPKSTLYIFVQSRRTYTYAPCTLCQHCDGLRQCYLRGDIHKTITCMVVGVGPPAWWIHACAVTCVVTGEADHLRGGSHVLSLAW